MKPHTLIRGAAMVGALTLTHAPIALAAGRSTGSSADAFERTPLHLGASTTTHAAASSGMGGSIVRTIVGLAIVIGVIYGLAWLLRHARAARNPSIGAGLEQVAALPLGTGRSVALVRVGTELHLLGIAEHAVTPIRSFTEDEAVDLGLPVTPPGEEETYTPRSGSPLLRVIDTLRQLTIR